jgi:hypothetical protein
MTLTPYRLPDGRVVAVHADVARGTRTIDYTLADGTIVTAQRVEDDEASYVDTVHIARLGACPTCGSTSYEDPDEPALLRFSRHIAAAAKVLGKKMSISVDKRSGEVTGVKIKE